MVERPKQPGTYRSEIAASVHKMMEGVYGAGLIDKQTMRQFDETCLSHHIFEEESCVEIDTENG